MLNTVYIETTIVSYLMARPSKDIHRLSHQLMTREWWDSARSRFELRTSLLVIEEASAGDPEAAAQRLKALDGIALVPASAEAWQLAERMALEMQLPPRARADAAHVAISAVNDLDYLLTWNCKHLANGMLQRKIESVCSAFGVRAPRILTPEQLMEPQ